MAKSAEEPWQLYYWNLAGRGEFVRVIFEEAGIPYDDISDRSVILENVHQGTKKDHFPAFAPPMLKKGSFTLAQTSVICRYLGHQFGLVPESEEDKWHAEQINITIHDYIAEGRLVFHGKGFVMSYYQQQEETKPYIEWFVNERIDKWLGHFEKCLAANNGGQAFVIGNKLTYVDLGLMHVLRATESQFPEKYKSMTDIPLLKAFKVRIEARPRLAAYFKSNRCRAFEGNSMM